MSRCILKLQSKTALTFSYRMPEFALSCDWLCELPTFLVIGQKPYIASAFFHYKLICFPNQLSHHHIHSREFKTWVTWRNNEFHRRNHPIVGSFLVPGPTISTHIVAIWCLLDWSWRWFPGKRVQGLLWHGNWWRRLDPGVELHIYQLLKF